MSAKLFRGDKGCVAGFRWQHVGSRESSLVEAPEAKSRGGDSEGGKLNRGPEPVATSMEQLEAMRCELAAVRAQSETAIRDAYQRGLKEGEQQAAAAGHAELENYQRQLAQSLAGMAAARQTLLAQTENDLVRLSVAIAEKVLNRQIQVDAEALRGVARAALERLAGKPVQAVRLHPRDRDALAAELSGMEIKGMRVLPDESLARGSILFETGYGVLDCSLSTQLEEIERGLVDRLQRSQQ